LNPFEHFVIARSLECNPSQLGVGGSVAKQSQSERVASRSFPSLKPTNEEFETEDAKFQIDQNTHISLRIFKMA